VLVVGVMPSGCGQEDIPLKKVEYVLDVPKDAKDTEHKGPKRTKGTSAAMKRDPSGMNP
jgi:hypothetical protein